MNSNNSKVIGQRINSALALRDKLQKDLAKHLGVKDNVVSYWCNGTRTPNTEQIIEMSNYLNVCSGYLLGLEKEPTNNIKKKAICEYTGLSDKSISVLHGWKNDNILDFLDFLLTGTSPRFLSSLKKALCDYEKYYSDALFILEPLYITNTSDRPFSFIALNERIDELEQIKYDMSDKEDRANEKIDLASFVLHRCSQLFESILVEFFAETNLEYKETKEKFIKNIELLVDEINSLNNNYSVKIAETDGEPNGNNTET